MPRFLLTCCAIALALPTLADPATLIIEKDFVNDFAEGQVKNALSASASTQELAGEAPLPAVFLHPIHMGDASLTFSDLSLPTQESGEAFLLFQIGIRDGANWSTTAAQQSNGARFSVAVNGQELFGETVRGDGWRPRAVSLSRWQGEQIELSFLTNAIEGNTNYDWCLIGQPLLITMPRLEPSTTWPKNTPGIGLVALECEGETQCSLSWGDARLNLTLPQGTHWLPLHFDNFGAFSMTLKQGQAKVIEKRAARHGVRISRETLALSTPVIVSGQPFNMIMTLRNKGLGSLEAALEEKATLSPQKPGLVQDLRTSLSSLAAQERSQVVWRNLIVTEAGYYSFKSAAGLEKIFFAFPPFPARIPDEAKRFSQDSYAVTRIGNAFSRLVFFQHESGECCARSEVWSGETWHSAALLYPLYRLDLAEENKATPPRFEFLDIAEGLCVSQLLDDASKITLNFSPADQTPCIRVQARLEAGRDLAVTAFSGPEYQVGSGSLGVQKDFALFPGLEYLEGDEASSSERDLFYPLSERRVPALHKIASPLMMVQAGDILTGLMWDVQQEWAQNERYPAARFLAPSMDSGYESIHMSLFAPSVGDYVEENSTQAKHPYPLKRGEKLSLSYDILLDHRHNHAGHPLLKSSHKASLILQAFPRYASCFGKDGLLPGPSPAPRSWEEEQALCQAAYASSVWQEDPPGWKHCYNWGAAPLVGHAVPNLLLANAAKEEGDRAAITQRVDKVLDRAIKESGPQCLWSNAGCHILMGELPFYYGYVEAALDDFKRHAFALLDQREGGNWVWHPQGKKYASLGIDGDHTLGQASLPLLAILRAARLTGDAELKEAGLAALKQMDSYEVPRGAQMWECPLYQPDILASAQAIRVYCEAWRLTGEERYLDEARYWAWTGLPFLYLWELPGYPTMRYNVISVIGSTFYSHSWLGLPVVWCGLAYAYALQDLAQYDASLGWLNIAEGITHSAMWQQYPDGPNLGTYPDSWKMLENRPNAPDINPENIVVNAFRLRGEGPQIHYHRMGIGDEAVVINSNRRFKSIVGEPASGLMSLDVEAGPLGYLFIASVPEPSQAAGLGAKCADEAALHQADLGWTYYPPLKALILKIPATKAKVPIEIHW